MIIYDGYKNDFLHSVENDTIAIQIQENIYRKMGRRTPPSEFRSWRESMKYMYLVMNDEDIPTNSGVAIEYNIPQSAKRVDFMISGYDKDNKPGMVIIELKQWETLNKVEDTDALVNTFTGGRQQNVVHPSYQAWLRVPQLRKWSSFPSSDVMVLMVILHGLMIFWKSERQRIFRWMDSIMISTSAARQKNCKDVLLKRIMKTTLRQEF